MFHWLWSLPLFIKLMFLPYPLILLVALGSYFVKEEDKHKWEPVAEALQALMVNGFLLFGILMFILVIII
jgi:hypothetical protein